jgi:drug/metabolite transporter (DMT)-like permease
MKDFFYFVIVSVFWGFTNPFIKRGSQGVEMIGRNSRYQQLQQIMYLATRWQFVIPFCINLSGSSVFYYLLGDADLSLAIPITNSLTFVMTFFAGFLLGEKITSREIMGICLILLGVVICVS